MGVVPKIGELSQPLDRYALPVVFIAFVCGAIDGALYLVIGFGRSFVVAQRCDVDDFDIMANVRHSGLFPSDV